MLFNVDGPLARHLRSNSSMLSMLLDIADSGMNFEVDKWGELLQRVEKESVEHGTKDNGIEEVDDQEENLLRNDKKEETATSLHLPSIYLRRLSGSVDEQIKWSKEFIKKCPAWEPEELALQKSLQKRPGNETASCHHVETKRRRVGKEISRI